MDFELSEEQRAIAETTRRFVEKEMPRQQVLQWSRDKVEPPQELFKKLGKMGYYGFLLPEAYSGLEKPDPMGMLAFVEQFARASSAITTAWGRVAVILAPLVAKFGTQAQKDMVLPRVMAGAGRRSETSHWMVNAIAAISAARLTKVQRQPNRPPSQVAMGRPNTVAKVMPLNTTASAWP